MTTELTRILYVEDEADIRAVADIALTRVGGFTLCLCASGAEALPAAREFAPELILLDVMMPGMDGLETLAALRADPALKDVPVAFMTARTLPAELDRYRTSGAIGVINKPFDPLSLAAEVRALWSARAGAA